MADGLKRARAAAKATRPPSNRWRISGVRGAGNLHYRSERAAYDAVEIFVAGGEKVTVYHWEDGSWKLYERIDPPTGG